MSELNRLLKEKEEMIRRGKEVEKVWGQKLHLVNKDYCGKILEINKFNHLSLHRHLKKAESFWVLEGPVCVTLVDESSGEHELYLLETGDILDIRREQLHSILAISDDAKVVEFSTTDSSNDSLRAFSSGNLNEEECNKLLTFLLDNRTDNVYTWRGKCSKLFMPIQLSEEEMVYERD